MRRPRYQVLTNLCLMVESARTPGQKMKALLLLRRFFNRQHLGELVASIDMGLHDLEERLTDFEREEMVRMEYLFPENLDNVPEAERLRDTESDI